MVLMLLMPSIIKLEHHHKHAIDHINGEKHNQTYTEKCFVCSFEFSVFLSGKIDTPSEKNILIDGYCNHYKSFYCSDHTRYSFLLRAPPAFTNI